MNCGGCSGPICPDDGACLVCGKCDPDYARGFRIERPMVRGDTEELDYDLFDREGAPLDLSAVGAKAWFTIKQYLTQDDSRAVFQGTIANGAVVARDGGSLASGRVRVTIPASATQGFPEGTQRLYYDLQVKDSLGRVTTVEKGVLLVDPDVTKSS